ncbi:MAG: helix-turn-helix transcriptional regulator [Nitrospirota bacterium]|jgi:AraC-like DNA-binding protein
MRAKSLPSALDDIPFDNPRLVRLGIEPMSLADVLRRRSDRRMVLPERVDFYMLLLVTSGRGKHTVDFVDWPVSAGCLVFVRPGQVQQWHANSTAAGQIVLIAPSALPLAEGLASSREMGFLRLDEWPVCIKLSRGIVEEVAEDLSRLRREFDRFDDSNVAVMLIRHLLLVLLLRVAGWHSGKTQTGYEEQVSRTTYRMFLHELEISFRRRQGVQHYARRLGYSESTLSRACVACEGRTAKVVIDRRVALEAQRLLAYSRATVAQISYQLGFSEPTNFVKFFVRMTGGTPTAFRLNMTRDRPVNTL